MILQVGGDDDLVLTTLLPDRSQIVVGVSALKLSAELKRLLT
jgi:hypothetical protein